MTCLGSGSSGNSILIQHDGRAVLVDAGFSASRLLAGMGERGLRADALDAILVTHEHNDHVTGLEVLSRRTGAPVVANSATLSELRRRFDLPNAVPFRNGEPLSIGRMEVSSLPVSHDAEDPVGFLVAVEGCRIAVFTDLGCAATAEMATEMARSDLIVIEANHDTKRLLDGPYPWHLKRRILSDRGHLSNRQSAELIAQAVSNRPQTFWLAHLSRTNNTKRGARNDVRGFLASQGLVAQILIAERDRPSLVWEPPVTDVQLALFGAGRFLAPES